MVRKKRPFGLVIIIILQLLNVAAWVSFFYGLRFPEFAKLVAPLVDITAVPTVVQLGSLGLLLIALPAVWFYKRWGWVLLMLQLGVSLSMGIWQFIVGPPNYVTMVLNVGVVFYLNQREVQQLFERQDETEVVAQTEAWG